MITIVLLGSGNVAHHLYTVFAKHKEIQIVQCYNRKGVALDVTSTIPVTQHLHKLKEADFYFLCISDNAIHDVSKQLPFQGKCVVHTSGGTDIDSIHPKNRAAVFYPFQSFSSSTPIDFKTVPIGIEATHKTDYIRLEELALLVSSKIFKISSEQRSIAHIAAVFVNNFTNHLYTIAHDICDTHELPFEILHPLLQETAQKILTLHPHLAQTGPAIRNDTKTIEKHVSLLNKPSDQELYNTLTNAIRNYYGKKL